MALVFCNGCFDILHYGHIVFLQAAKMLGGFENKLVVAVNSDRSARKLKLSKWGDKYPIDSLEVRMQNLAPYADIRRHFDTENELLELIWFYEPCIIVKGPDYIGKHVVGENVAPVLILDTPEPESVKQMKRERYGIISAQTPKR